MTYRDFDLGQIQTGASGIDGVFETDPALVSPQGAPVPELKQATMVRVGSVQQLQPFTRISAETLVNKATNDLWALKKDTDGYFIQRLFEDDGSPLKG